MSLMRPLSSLQSDLNRIFYDLEREIFSPMATRRTAEGTEGGLLSQVWVPPIDIHEEENEVVAQVSLPGIRPEDIEVEVEGNLLSLRGETRRTEEEKKRNYYRKEIVGGSFYRQVQLPCEVQAEKAKAVFENGLVTIHLPKSEQTRRHKIKVGR